jgi:hypothetical protein
MGQPLQADPGQKQDPARFFDHALLTLEPWAMSTSEETRAGPSYRNGWDSDLPGVNVPCRLSAESGPRFCCSRAREPATCQFGPDSTRGERRIQHVHLLRQPVARTTKPNRRQTLRLSVSMPAHPSTPIGDRHEVVEGDGDSEAGAELCCPVENGLLHFRERLALQTARNRANRTKPGNISLPCRLG